MPDKTDEFKELIEYQWGYLVTDYGFVLAHMQYSDYDDPSLYHFYSRIEYNSSRTVVEIEISRHDPYISVGPVSEPQTARLGVATIMDYYGYAEALEKLSPEVDSSRRLQLELRLARHAAALRSHCEPILRGDFSQWLDMCRYHLKRMNDWYRSRTGQELDYSQSDFVKWLSSKDPNASGL